MSSSRVYTREYLNKPVSERETMLRNQFKSGERLFQSESLGNLGYINRNEYVNNNYERATRVLRRSKVRKMTDEIFQDRQTGYR